MTWQQLTEKDCRGLKLLVIVPHDRHIWYDIYHGAASQLPGRGPLMWMLPLYLHVNKKFDDPDDDHDHEKHHWHMVDSKSQCPPQHCFSDFFTRTKPGTGLTQCTIIGSSNFLLTCRYRSNIHIPFQAAGLLHTWQISYQISRYVYHESFHSLQSLCQLLLCHLGPPRSTLSINLYVKGSLDCTIGAFHMSIPAEPFLLQNDVQILNPKPCK